MERRITHSRIMNFIFNSSQVLGLAGMTYMLDGEAGIQVHILEALLKETGKLDASIEEIDSIETPLLKNISKIEYSVIYQENLAGSINLEAENINLDVNGDNVSLKKIKGWNDGNTMLYEGTVFDGSEQMPLELRVVIPGVNNPWEMRVYERRDIKRLKEGNLEILPVITAVTAITETAPKYRRGGKKCIEEFRDILTLYGLMRNEDGMKTLSEEYDFGDKYRTKYCAGPKAKTKKMYEDAIKLYKKEVRPEIIRITDLIKEKRKYPLGKVETYNF